MNRPTAATFALHNPDIRTSLSLTATGVMLVVNIPGICGGSVAVMVSEADVVAVERLLAGEINRHAGVQVTDLITGRILTVKPDDCGSGCKCALKFVKTTW